MLAKQIDRYPVEPRPRIGPGKVIRSASLERNREDLGSKILREIGSNPPAQKPINDGIVTVKDRREHRRIGYRLPDQGCVSGNTQRVVRCDHHHYLTARVGKVPRPPLRRRRTTALAPAKVPVLEFAVCLSLCRPWF